MDLLFGDGSDIFTWWWNNPSLCPIQYCDWTNLFFPLDNLLHKLQLLPLRHSEQTMYRFGNDKHSSVTVHSSCFIKWWFMHGHWQKNGNTSKCKFQTRMQTYRERFVLWCDHVRACLNIQSSFPQWKGHEECHKLWNRICKRSTNLSAENQWLGMEQGADKDWTSIVFLQIPSLQPSIPGGIFWCWTCWQEAHFWFYGVEDLLVQ